MIFVYSTLCEADVDYSYGVLRVCDLYRLVAAVAYVRLQSGLIAFLLRTLHSDVIEGTDH